MCCLGAIAVGFLAAKGGPPSRVDADKVAELRAQGISWRQIAALLGVGIGTVHRAAQERSKSHSLAAPVSS
jgi:DNA invertase Pin-like site-specific DNA recombinase